MELAPADDILITVERPTEIDTEAHMVASILAKRVVKGGASGCKGENGEG